MEVETGTADAIRAAAAMLAKADGLIIAAGAGIGVDSGLPDFRGAGGFWRHYPALGRAGIDFYSIASPRAFAEHPRLAWGFYGHRLRLYRATVPNPGFALLQEIAGRMPHGAFVFTSNVDGQFRKAGFDPERILEIHGSIHHLQCLSPCTARIWPAAGLAPEVDEEHCLLTSELPRCPHCGGVARPNVLMFGDGGWAPQRTAAQERRLARWRALVRRPAIVEIGAGTDVPTVRLFAESAGGDLIRINPREPQVAPGAGIGLAMTGLQALRLIHAALAGA